MLLIIALSGTGLQAGVWPQGEGNGYMNLSFTYLRYQEVINGSLFDPGGFDKLYLKRTVSDHTLNGYLEYGLSDRLTIIANVPFKFLKTGDEIRSLSKDPFPNDTLQSGTLNTLSNIDVGGRYLLHKGDYLWSVQMMGGFNSASYQNKSGLRSGYDAWYVTPKVQFGRGFGKTYFSASIGYRFKTNGYPDDLVTDNEFGYKWERNSGHPTWFVLTIGAELPLTNGNHDDQNSDQTGLYRDEEGFVDPGLKINHYFSDHWAINVSSIGAIWAKHGGNQLTYTAGFSYEW